MEKLIGRIDEIKVLKSLMESDKPEFVAIYGRRRIGKTFLIRSVFDNKFLFQMTGIANVLLEQQLANFYVSYNLQSIQKISDVPKNWFEVFAHLRLIVEKSRIKNKIIFLDELPWMDTPRSNFIPALEHFWNSFGSTQPSLKLIVCGSAASWMINKLINNKGGLHNRVTKRLFIKPFTLQEVEVYLKSKSINLDRYQILQLYFVMGGIPFYLNEIEKGWSAFQLIDKLCFSENGFLRSEYQNLFYSLFQNAETHLAVIEALCIKSKGLTRDEIIKIAKINNGGTTTKVLEELEVSGFIKKYQPYNRKLRNSLYQLTDPYCLFYHKFIKNSKATGENTWINLIDSSAYRAWSGYAFEYACMSHIDQIKKALGISGIYTEISSWRGQNADNQGTQIDLLIDRKDNIITICEIKFSSDSFVINKAYANSLRNKIGIFKSESKTKKLVFLAMITTHNLKENEYSLGLVQNKITMDALFT